MKVVLFRRLTALLLLVALLTALPPTAGAAPAAAEFDLPNTWSRDALIFAVENGILQGRGGGDLAPQAPLTRAEAAAVMTRLLGASLECDLSVFSDALPGAWYQQELGTAVALGIFQGVGQNKIQPDASITREQAFTVLARTFGLTAEDPAGCRRFTDWVDISPYAWNAVSALTEQEIVQGYPDGTIGPQRPITREEFAQILYQFLDAVCDEPDALPSGGRVLYRGSAPLPAGLRLDGSLVLGCGWSGAQTLSDCQITGTLTVRCLPGTALTIRESRFHTLNVASACEVTADRSSAVLLATADGASVTADAEVVRCTAGAALSGNFQTVEVHGGNPTLSGVISGRLTVSAYAVGQTVTVDSQVSELLVWGRNTRVQGGGYAATASVLASGCSVTLACGALTQAPLPSLQPVSVRLIAPQFAGSDAPTVTLTAEFSGATEPLDCQLWWYCGNRLLNVEEHFTLTAGAKATCDYTFDFSQGTPPAAAFRVYLVNGPELRSAGCTVGTNPYSYDYGRALSTVKTVRVECAILQDTYLYADSSLSTAICPLKKGDIVYNYYYTGYSGIEVLLQDGTFGWVPRNKVHISETDYTQYTDYSTGTKEGFVNQMGYSSKTEYLIWISLKTQKVNVYRGGKGRWVLVRSCPCATGKNATPTISGVFEIRYKRPLWDFGSYQVYNVTGFYGGHAFHSRTYRGEGKQLLDGSMGFPVSHGCVRMLDADCLYIYNLPYETTVVVY